MKGGNIDEEQKRGYGGALQGPDFDRRFRARSALKDQGARAFLEEEDDPVNHVGGDVFCKQEGSEF